MNKLAVLLLAWVSISCTNTKKEQKDEGIRSVTNQSKGISGYLVTSEVVPYYLPDYRMYYKGDRYEFKEQLSSDGLAIKLEIYEKEETPSFLTHKIEYQYNEDKLLIKFLDISLKYQDTVRKVVTWNNRKGIVTATTATNSAEILLDNIGNILEIHETDNPNPNYYIKNEFDSLGRPVTTIRAH